MMAYAFGTVKIKVRTIYLWLLSVLFIYSTSTFLRLSYNFYVAVFGYISFILMTWASGFRWHFFSSKLLVGFLAAFISSLMFFVNGAGDVWTVYVSGEIHIFFWGHAFAFLADHYPQNTIKRFLWFHLLVLLISMVATLHALELYPLAARAMYGHADGIKDANFLHKIGCGGFGFVYGFVCLAIGLVAAIRKKDTKTSKIGFIAFFILTVCLIIKSNFTMALLFFFLTMGLCVLYAEKKENAVGTALVLILFTLGFIFQEEIVLLLKRIGEYMRMDMLVDKMTKIEHAQKTDNWMSLKRFQVYNVSVQGFLSNPIFGSGYASEDSQILTMLSYIGIFGLSYIYLLWAACDLFAKYVNKIYMKVFFILIIIISTLNMFTDMTLMSMVFFLTPALLYWAAPAKENG